MNTSAARLFGTVARSDALRFYRNHAFQPKAVADFLGLPNADIAKLVNVAKGSVRFDEAMPRAVFERLEEIADIANQVANFFGGDAAKTALWFRTSNPLLGDISPRDMIRFGRYEKLRRFIVNATVDAARDSQARAGAAGGK